MTYRIDRLDFGSVRIDESMRLRGVAPGNIIEVPAQGYLVRGHGVRFLVDAGYRDVSVLGMGGTVTAENGFHEQLARYDTTVEDLDFVILTHAHRDHAGHIDKVPLQIPVVINRDELSWAASGLQGHAYARDDVLHLIERMYSPGAIRFLDLGTSGPEQVAPGVMATVCGGHTPGSIALTVPTAGGDAYLCGDLMYDIRGALTAQPRETFVGRVQPTALALDDPAMTNNFAVDVRHEMGALKRARQHRYILAAHDAPAVIENGRWVAYLEGDSLPASASAFPGPPDD